MEGARAYNRKYLLPKQIVEITKTILNYMRILDVYFDELI